MNIEFYKSNVNNDVKRLLKKLDYPLDSVIQDIENGYLAVYKVLVGLGCVGIIVIKIEVNHFKDREFVVCHTIAEDDIDTPFYKILGISLPLLAKKFECQIIRHHADRNGMIKMLQDFNYYPTEIVFRKRIGEKCQDRKVLQHKQVNQLQLIKTSE